MELLKIHRSIYQNPWPVPRAQVPGGYRPITINRAVRWLSVEFPPTSRRLKSGERSEPKPSPRAEGGPLEAPPEGPPEASPVE